MSVKIFLDHGLGYRNLGDEAILLNAIRKLNWNFPGCDIIIPTKSIKLMPSQLPENIKYVPSVRILFTSMGNLCNFQQKLYNKKIKVDITKYIEKLINYIKKISHWGLFKRLLNSISSCDIFYGAGGAYFNDYFPSGLLYKRWMYNQIPDGTISVLSSQGFGPIKNLWSLNVFEQAVNNLDIVTFRDYSNSKKIFNNIDFSGRTYTTGDEAFDLPKANEKEIKEYFSSIKLDYNTSFIAFHYRNTDYTQETKHLITKLAAIIDNIDKNIDKEILFVPMKYGGSHESDISFGNKIKKLTSNSTKMYIGPKCKNARTIKGVIGQADITMGLSYHLHVFGTSQNIPPVIIYSGDYYRMKSEGLLGWYGLKKQMIDIESVCITEVVNRVLSTFNSYDGIVSFIREGNQKIEKRKNWLFKRLKKKVK